MSRKTKRNQPDPGQANPQSEPARSSRMGLVIGIVVVALVAVVLAATVLKDDGSESNPSGTAAAATALVSEGAPTLGEASAKVHIVEFLDPACETCAQFYPLVKKLVADNPGQIRVSLRHVAFHEGSDYVVRLLEASRKQDKYWPTLEVLLSSQAMWAPHHTVQPEFVMQAIAGVGLDLARLKTDMDSPDVIQRVAKDRDDAIAMKVTATPEYFVNGRPLPSFGAQQLLNLVGEELQKAN